MEIERYGSVENVLEFNEVILREEFENFQYLFILRRGSIYADF